MEIVAIAGEKIEVAIWSISSGHCVATLEGHTKSIQSVCFSPCGTLLASGSEDGTVILWDCQTWTRIHTFNQHSNFITSLNFSKASDRIISSSYEDTRVFRVDTMEQELIIETHARHKSSACFNYGGDLVALGVKNLVNMYDAQTGELKESLTGHSMPVHFVDYSTDGRLLVSSSNIETIIWDVASGSALRNLRGTPRHVQINADASRIVSASFDKKVRIRDVSTDEHQLALAGHIGYVTTCCFSEDGSKVISGSTDGTVKVWDSCTGEELRTLSSDFGVVRAISYRPSVTGSYI